MDENQVRAALLDFLATLPEDWYLPRLLIGSVGCDEEMGLDALCDLQVDKRVELYEFEDGIRVRFCPPQPKLTEAQQSFVTQYIPLAKRISAAYAKRHPHLSEEFRSAALLSLSQLGLKVEEPITEKVEKQFVAYARKSISGEMKMVLSQSVHLRGMKNDDKNPGIEKFLHDKLDDGTEIHELGHLDPAWIDQDEIATMIESLELAEKQLINLAIVRGMSEDECTKVIGVNSFGRRKKALTTLRGKFVYATDGIKQKEPESEVKQKEPNYPFPRFYLGFTAPFRPMKKGTLCWACLGRPLKESEYCLSCDRWGMDYMLKVLIEKKTHKNYQLDTESRTKTKVKPDVKVNTRGMGSIENVRNYRRRKKAAASLQ